MPEYEAPRPEKRPTNFPKDYPKEQNGQVENIQREENIETGFFQSSMEKVFNQSIGLTQPRMSDSHTRAWLATLKRGQSKTQSTTPEAKENANTNNNSPYLKLLGLENTYATYKNYLNKKRAAEGQYHQKTDSWTPAPQSAIQDFENEHNQLNDRLLNQGFCGGIAEFEAQQQHFITTFEQETVKIALTQLANYEQKLKEEAEKYSNSTNISALHQDLGNFRTQQKAFEQAQKQKEQQQHSAGINLLSGTSAANRQKNGNAPAKYGQTAGQELKKVANCHPLLAKNKNAPRTNIDPSKLAATTDSQQLGSYLQQHIHDRLSDISRARAALADHPELIYQMDNLLKKAYQIKGIQPDSIHEQLLEAKKGRLETKNTLDNAFLGIMALVFSIGSMGTGLPAALMGGSALGVSSYMAYEEFVRYDQETAAGGSGLASGDPGIAWLVVAVLGAGLDLGAAAKAIKTLQPLAKSLKNGDDLTKFQKELQILEQAGKLDKKIAEAAHEAAEAKVLGREAREELRKTLAGKVFSGPAIDPVAYKALVKMAYNYAKSGMFDLETFILRFLKARKLSKISDLPKEDLLKLEAAFEEGQSRKALFSRLEFDFIHLKKWLREAEIPKKCIAKILKWDDECLAELNRAFAKFKYADLAEDLKNPVLVDALETVIKNPKNAWDEIREKGEEMTLAVENLAKSQFFQHFSAAGRAFEKEVSQNIGKIPTFAKYLDDGFTHLSQLHFLSPNGKMIIPDDVLVKLMRDEFGSSYFKAVYNDSKLMDKTPWSKNQKSELIDVFRKNPEKEFIEFEVRTNDELLKDKRAPEKFKKTSRARIYRSEIFKTISNGNGEMETTIKNFD